MKSIIAAVAITAGMLAGGAAQAQNNKVTLAVAGKVILWSPVIVAEDKGYFKQEGLDAEVTWSSQGSPPAIAAALSGSALMAFVGGPDAMNGLVSGAPYRLVFNSGNQLTLEFTASNQLIAKSGITSAAPLEKRVAVLKGQRIGVWTAGDTQSQVVSYAAKKYGIDPASLTLVMTQNGPNELAAFQKGALDIMVLSPPFPNQAENLKLGKTFMTSREIPGLAGYPYLVGIASQRNIAEKRTQVKAAIKAMARAVQLLRKDPASAKVSVRKAFPDMDPKAFDDGFKTMLSVLPASPVLTSDGFGVFNVLQSASESKQQGMTYAAAVDPTIAAEVAKEIGQ